MIGRKLAHYEVTAKLGQGGMGEVYRAHDPRTGRDVALKVLPPAFAADAERLARFRREARTLAGLNHRNIAALYGVEEDEGQPFLVMEVAEGQSLADRIAAGRVPLQDALEIALQIAEGLEEAHEKGVVHRDLKPANVVVGPQGVVKILDFGLARAYEGQGVAGEDDIGNSPTITAAMTREGTVLGTAAYMSPEQARGRGIDRRSDLWAFGAILWEMLTGQRLFMGETVSDTIAAILKTDPPWEELPPDTPHGVRRLLERCLERDVRNRLRDVGEARIRLQRWLQDPASLEESFVTSEVPRVLTRRPSWLPWIVAGAAVAVALLATLRGRDPGEPASPELTLEIRLPDQDKIPTGNFAALSLSPDGRYLMWSTETALRLRPAGSFEDREIPMSTRTQSAAFSPDSRWIAYAQSGKLFRQSVTGGAAQAICEMIAARGISWIDDEHIVVAPDYATGLSVVNVTDGTLRELTTLRTGERSHRWPFVVPGHDEVLFMTQYPGRKYDDSDIETVSLTNGERRTLYRGGANPRWAPTGHLIFARGKSLFAVSYQPGDAEARGVATPVLDDVLALVGDQELDDGSVHYGFDDRGTVIYRRSTSPASTRSRMAWLDLQSGAVSPLGDAGFYEGPRVSPDGNHVAVRRGLDAESQIVVLDLATGAERPITRDPGLKYVGPWSVDSRTVYWVQGDPTGSYYEVRRADRDGSRTPETFITYPHSAYAETFSPDGRWLLLTGWNPQSGYDEWRIDMNAAQPSLEPYLAEPGDQFVADFTSNGRFLLHADGFTGAGDWFVRGFPDPQARWRIGPKNPQVDEMHWSARGDAILECSPAGLRTYPVTTTADAVEIGQGELLFEPHWLLRTSGRDVAVHPDGRRLLILVPDEPTERESAPSIVLKTGWFDELRRVGESR